MRKYIVIIGASRPRLINAADADLAYAIAKHAADYRGDEAVTVRLARPEEINRFGPPISAPPRERQMSLYRD